MKQFVASLFLSLCCATMTSAQTFLSRLQRQATGQGKVTVTQSSAIDELVNGNSANINTTPKQTTTPAKPQDTKKEPTHTQHDANGKKKDTTTTAQQPSQPSSSSSNNEMEIPTVDTRKKVMAKSYKVNGYRVQAFAGGNTRNDRQKAERIGNDIKYAFPNEPIYVHFYSPRWICRVGNYRTYEEAHRMLLEIRRLGYKQASIVKGKISVQY